MKKTIASFLGLMAMIALCVAGGQNPDGSCNLGWTLTCLAVAALCAWVFDILFPYESVHVEDETYDDLNKQIDEYASQMEDGYEEYEVESDNVVLTVGIHVNTTAIKFRDDAWGNVKTFTEVTWHCDINVIDVVVYNKRGVSVEKHDFDEALIEDEIETSSMP